MTRWWRDTLFRRLFLLICAAVVASHLVAWAVVTRLVLPLFGEGAPHGGGPPQVLGSLPPTPGLPGGPTAAPTGTATMPATPGSATATDTLVGAAPRLPPRPAPPRLPMPVLLIDYGIRMLVIGVAAWWAARWVSQPVRRMADTAREMGESVVLGRHTVRLDERQGTVEVREAARVFNQMAARLAQEFRSRGLLMASISHDLRTPLTRMRMRLESLTPRPLAQRCVADIREMNELIDGAIYIFRSDQTPDETMQPTDVYALVQSLVDDLAEQGQPVTLQGQPVVTHARPAALKRAVSNLIGNALRHAGSAQLTVLTLEGVRIFVDDQGPGIPDAQLAEVFRPFLRLDPSRSRETGGAGLGLFIARDLLQQQGATLALANRSGGGLRAEIRLGAAAG